MLCVLVNIRFQVLFHSAPAVLFTFPSRYFFAIGHQVVFRLGGWSPHLPSGFHVSAGTPDTAACLTISPTGLSPCLVCLPIQFGYRLTMAYAVHTPGVLLLPVWPPPRSLATTCGISVDFFSSPYLDVSVRAVPHIRLFDSAYVDTVLPCRVSPFGNLRIDAYLPLPVAYRSLSRPSSAPDAKAFPLRSFQLDLVVAHPASAGLRSA